MVGLYSIYSIQRFCVCYSQWQQYENAALNGVEPAGLGGQDEYYLFENGPVRRQCATACLPACHTTPFLHSFTAPAVADQVCTDPIPQTIGLRQRLLGW